MSQLRYLVDLIAARDEQISSSLPFIGLEDIESYTGRLVERTVPSLYQDVDKVSESKSGTKFCKGDVLFGKLRPYLAKAWLAEFEGICTTEALVLRPHSIEPRYLRFFLLSPGVLGAVGESTFGSKMPRSDWQHIGNLAVPDLSIEQQCEVADRLDRELGVLTEIEGTVRNVISLITERRASVIQSGVIGQFISREAV